MSAFQETIESFQDYILDKDQTIAQKITGESDDFKRVRLEVYHSSYSLRLLEILGKAFPGLRNYLGEEHFEQLCREYIHSYPSNHFSVRYFGRHFSKFLANHGKIDPIVVELAMFEWALEDAIDAPDAPQLTFDDLAALTPESWAALTLTTHPSLQIIPFSYETPAVWKALKDQETLPPIERHEQPVNWLMWRFNRQAYFRPTTKEQLWMMDAFRNGENFSDICTGLCEWLEEDKVISFAAETLRQWITEGIFSEFNV